MTWKSAIEARRPWASGGSRPFAVRRFTLALLIVSAVGIGASHGARADDELFDSTADTVFDLIRTGDPSSFTCMEYLGQGDRRIWDKRVDGEPIVDAYLFRARFSDGVDIEIAINPEFGSKQAARDEAERYTTALGQLPTLLREGISHFSVHKGDSSFHAGAGQIVVYTETVDDRLGYDHLEESLFHEAVHASLDDRHRLAADWIAAQKADGRFMTSYAKSSPEREDLAETALFAYAIVHHPIRFPPTDTEDVRQAVPNRLAYIEKLFPPDEPVFRQVAQQSDCGPDAS